MEGGRGLDEGGGEGTQTAAAVVGSCASIYTPPPVSLDVHTLSFSFSHGKEGGRERDGKPNFV